ncbi:hypothetical protein ACJMK2_010050, partial [Sinanodonta woodiana]
RCVECKDFNRRCGECIIRHQQTLWRMYHKTSVDVVERVLYDFIRRCGVCKDFNRRRG